jgi:ABC-type nitrate/sulfonate/bicarbonate transport system substrate-binding protein
MTQQNMNRSFEKRRREKRHTCVVLIASLQFFLIGIVLPAFSRAATPTPQKVTIAYPTLTPIVAGLWMAKEIGAFEKYGVKADLVFISSGPTTIQVLTSAHIDLAVSASNAVVNAILGGAPLIAVGSITNRPAMSLWVPAEITKPEQLDGKIMGITRHGSTTDFLTRMVLEKVGLQNRVKIQPFGGGTEADTAFRAGIIAGRVGAVKPGPNAHVLLDLSEMGIPFSMDLVAVTRSFLKSSPKTVEAVLRAYTEGVAALTTTRTKAFQVIGQYMRLRPETTSQQDITEHYDYAVKYLDRIPRVEPAVIQTVLTWIGKGSVPVERFFDNRIMDQLVREGFVDGLYKKGDKQ